MIKFSYIKYIINKVVTKNEFNLLYFVVKQMAKTKNPNKTSNQSRL